MRPRQQSILDYKEFPILVVDDEVENLRIFELSFRRQFTILTARSGPEALEILQTHPVAVIVSDHRMPEMSGTDFLRRSREVDDAPIRILLTAYGDTRTLAEAINDGGIYRYLSKPYDPQETQLTLRRAIEVYALAREREMLLEEMTQLNHLSRELYQELDVEGVARALVRNCHQHLGFDGAALLLFDQDGDRLDWTALEPRDSEVSASLARIDLSRSRCEIFFDRLASGEVQMLQIERMGDMEAPIAEWMAEVSADQILVVPIVGQKRVRGAIAVDNRAGSRVFAAEERTLLDGVTTLAAIALQNARLVRDLRRSREHVLRADRLGTLGTLAAGLAHEINNPLVSIHTFLSLAPERRDMKDDEFWGSYHKLACSEVDRIRDLVATMSNLARGDHGRRDHEPVDAGYVAREVATLLQQESQNRDVLIEVNERPGTPKLMAVRNQLHQMILNLVLNGLHAAAAGGKVTIHVSPDLESRDPAACICVEDDGCGIPEENLERVFDPFFTTKDPDQGTGLGLMITHQIVADHGGTIDVQSAPGHGSRFRVCLPVCPPAAAPRLLHS